jgi:hypothetical protein
MIGKTNYLDGLRKLRETLGRLLKENSKQLQPVYVPLHRKKSHVVRKHSQN